jgi:hypothetical protein
MIWLDHEIEAVSAIQMHSFIHDRKRHLPSEDQAGMSQLVAEAFLAGRLEQTGTEVTVNFYGETNDLFGQQFVSMRRCHFH